MFFNNEMMEEFESFDEIISEARANKLKKQFATLSYSNEEAPIILSDDISFVQ